MSFTVEADYMHKNLRCVVILGSIGHRCGYVGIDKNHSLYGVDYHEKSEILKSKLEWLKTQTIGKRGIIPTLCWDGESVSPDMLFDVHGGLTYSGGNKQYPVEAELWWYGFDCNHFDDNPIKCNTSYCIEECNSLAEQLAKFKEE